MKKILSEQEKKRLTFEKTNRRKKINVLVKEIDKDVYIFLKAMSKSWWNKAFLAMEQVPPSLETVAEILKRYERRWNKK